MFMLTTKLLQPVSIQLIVQGQVIEFTQQPPFYSQVDVLIICVGAFSAGASGAFLLRGVGESGEQDEVEAVKPDPSVIIERAEDDSERAILEILNSSGGSMFQSDLVERSGFSKGKVSLVLDRLEARGVIRRERSGMTNLISIVGNQ